MNNVPAASPVLLYDGSCGFCNHTVQLVLRRDRLGTLRFASLQSPFAERVIEGHPELSGIDSVVWVDPATGQILTRSAAALRVVAYLGGLWRVALIFRLIPRPIRDWAYGVIARHRHCLMRTEPHCLVPAEEVRHRFLDTEFLSSDGPAAQQGVAADGASRRRPA
jgi:predicted DCC family thiol-disulfide oxidoreductase YuxK